MVRERSVVLPAKNGGGTFSVDSDGRGPPLVTVVMVRRSSAEGHRLALGPRLTKNILLGPNRV